jgi:uncharacterized protein YlxW (UPF0749 family)
MKCDMNKFLMTAEDFIKYATPETADESLLFEALTRYISLQSDLQEEVESLEDELADANTAINERDAALEKLEARVEILETSLEALEVEGSAS